MIEGQLKDIGIKNKRQKKAVDRLGFIRLKYLGYSVIETCAISGITIKTGYNQQKAWNDSGMNSIMPNYGGGRPASMTLGQKAKFKEAVARDMMTTVETGAFFKEYFGIEFAPKHIRSMLRSMGFRHAKPYDIDYCRLADAETVLKKDSDPRWTL